jgi:hypothetical protein
MLEDFPLEISQRLIRLVGSMGTRFAMQEQQKTDCTPVSCAVPLTHPESVKQVR